MANKAFLTLLLLPSLTASPNRLPIFADSATVVSLQVSQGAEHTPTPGLVLHLGNWNTVVMEVQRIHSLSCLADTPTPGFLEGTNLRMTTVILIHLYNLDSCNQKEMWVWILRIDSNLLPLKSQLWISMPDQERIKPAKLWQRSIKGFIDSEQRSKNKRVNIAKTLESQSLVWAGSSEWVIKKPELGALHDYILNKNHSKSRMFLSSHWHHLGC